MHLVDVSAVEREADENEAKSEFARSAGIALAGFDLDDLAKENLSLVFSLSAWLRSTGIDIASACAALLALRRGLLEVSGLDKSSEPVPLLAGEPRTALIALATYLYGLIERSATCSTKHPEAIVEEALARLQ